MLASYYIIAGLLASVIFYKLCHSLFISPLAKIPGPKAFALTSWRLAYEDYNGTRTRTIHALHQKYGPVVRIGPNEVSCNSISALKSVYGAGSGFERTSFYHMFEVYGRKNMFSFPTVKAHGERKKMFAHAYAKSAVMNKENASLIERKVRLYMELLGREEEKEEGSTSEIFSSLHYFSLDTITEFLYGRFGKTACLEGRAEDRALIQDISDHARRKLAWFAVHLPAFTQWLYSRTGIMREIARHFYPMQTPTTYSGIRAHALKACKTFGSCAAKGTTSEETSLISKLWRHHMTQKNGGIDDLDIASECADHLLAGIDTTSDTLMFLIWSLSRREHRDFQKRLIQEVRDMSTESINSDGVPMVDKTDNLPYVDAVIKETLRLFAPLPGSEPRSLSQSSTIDGYAIPARTVVSISPYTLHRNPDVFPDPFKFNPERWLNSSQNLAQMKKCFWAFSSGGRMCIGIHLAMAEMTTLVAAIYRKYTTTAVAGFDTLSPGITSRYEVFYDEGCSGVREHECRIEFKRQ
ncbi:hypothetical protein UA08_03098 [Talaromyces atroroseus]|uniref:Benzoate 4-monooxygenase n=1 Tax=Talaromyces atroroseus TaxID=1441469 RepID=A0A225AUY9_TALAT|nr:hypothetical protein UA08_03098 [Talaromyces atroroseus]OKL61118.1 hypothetical protein UA08_03098 [Talaromyces atroroseus]